MNKIVFNKKLLFFPIKLFLCFLVFTEILFFLGPINYKIDNTFYLVLYLAILNLSLYYGYKTGIKKYNYNKPILNIDYTKTLKFILIFSLLFTFVRTQFISPLTFALKVFEGIISPVSGYTEKSEATVGMLTYIVMICSSVTYMAIPLGVYNWSKLKWIYKAMLWYIIFVEIGVWLSVGTRKGVLDVLLVVIMLTIAKNPRFITDTLKYKKYYLAVIGAVAAFIFYFIYSNLSRYNADSFDVLEHLLAVTIKPFYANNFPTSVYISLYSIESYLCQGYYALAKALSLDDFCFTYGLGSSWFQVNLVEKFGYNVIPDTYLYALEQKFGIDHAGNWHTIYVWLANDFTFFGVPFVVYYIGKYFAKSWIETILNRDFFAPVVFSLFSLMIFYFFANNQVLSFSFIPFVTSLFLWKFKFRFK